VVDRLRTFLSSGAEILDAISHEPPDSAALNRRLFERGRQIANELSIGTPENAKATVTNLVRRVEIRADRIRIGISRARLTALLAAQSTDLPLNEENGPNDSADDILTIVATAKLARVGREMKMLIDGQDDTATADPSLLRVIARAHDIQERLTQDTGLSAHDIARQEQVSAAYVYTLLRLPWLAPDITTAIVNGKQPPQLSAKRLMRLTARLPIDWAEQRTLLGFAENKRAVL
jgi:site-specific DNA recombinase